MQPHILRHDTLHSLMGCDDLSVSDVERNIRIACVCVRVCICMYVCMLYIYIYIFIYTHSLTYADFTPIIGRPEKEIEKIFRKIKIAAKVMRMKNKDNKTNSMTASNNNKTVH